MEYFGSFWTKRKNSGYTFVLDNQEVAELRLKILTTTQEDADNKGVKPLVKHTIKRKKK